MSNRLKPCQGCGRSCRECWLMPCLYLECILTRSASAVRRWGKRGGLTITCK